MEETKPYVMNGPSKMHQPLRLNIQFFAENKVEYGLSNVHYATYAVLDGVITFDTPIPIRGAVTMTASPLGESTAFYADNMVYYLAESNNGYEATLSIARIPDQFAIDALGEVLDEVDGVQHEVANPKKKPFALLFQFEGDEKNVRHIFWDCLAGRPTLTGNTKGETTEITPTELPLTARPVILDGHILTKTKTTTTTTPAIYDAWFDTVYRKVETP